jgi:hypothetical protein
MAERAAATAEEVSEEYRRLGTAQARAERMHSRAVTAAADRSLPEPGMKVGKSNHFEASSWSIVYDGKALEAPGVTNARWEELQSIGAGHELDHSFQWLEMGRYHMGLTPGLTGEAACLELGYDVNKAAPALDGLGALTPQSAGYADAKKWYESVYGVHGDARNAAINALPEYLAVSDAQQRALRLERDIAADYALAQRSGRSQAELAQIRARIERASEIAERIEVRLEPLEEKFQEYRNLPEEVDARNNQDAFRRIDANRREAAKLKAEVDRLQAEAEAAAASSTTEPAPPTERTPPPTWDIDDEDTVRDLESHPLLRQ